jgi:PKD repeat protein
MPDGAPKGWPADEANPTVNITAAGIYAFNLWVTDDDGSVSEPDTIKFTVGSAVDPAVMACVESVFPDVTPECAECMCSKGAMCQMAVTETACNADCWGLIRCIGAMCPDFMPGGPTDCVVGMCMPFLAGAMAAGPAGMCVRMCVDVCRAPAPMP